MKIYISLLLILTLLLAGCSVTDSQNATKDIVAVSIIPQKTFAEAIVGDTLDVISLIPAGSSPETYQPSPKIIRNLENAKLYFTIGVEAEKANIIPMINQLDNLTIIDLQSYVNQRFSPRYFHKDEQGSGEGNSIDPHIWLSPKRAIAIVEKMTDELIKTYPAKEEIFKTNSENYIASLEALDQELNDKLSTLDNKDFIIYHPAYGYFAQDYNLNMIEIEAEGKTASIQGLDQVIKTAKEKKLTTVFYQEELSSKQAELVAQEINGTTYQLKPLSSNYIESLREFANQLTETGD